MKTSLPGIAGSRSWANWITLLTSSYKRSERTAKWCKLVWGGHPPPFHLIHTIHTSNKALPPPPISIELHRVVDPHQGSTLLTATERALHQSKFSDILTTYRSLTAALHNLGSLSFRGFPFHLLLVSEFPNSHAVRERGVRHQNKIVCGVGLCCVIVFV